MKILIISIVAISCCTPLSADTTSLNFFESSYFTGTLKKCKGYKIKKRDMICFTASQSYFDTSRFMSMNPVIPTFSMILLQDSIQGMCVNRSTCFYSQSGTYIKLSFVKKGKQLSDFNIGRLVEFVFKRENGYLVLLSASCSIVN